MPPKDKIEMELVKKRKKTDPPDLVWNEETKRWVKKDGAVGKRIEEKKKEKEKQERKSSIVMYNFGVGPRFAYVSASARAPK